jgi:hypothetical protein
MKIQPIEFPLGIGIADELRIIIDKGVAYYNLVDTTQTTVMYDDVEFAFKVLHSSKLKLEEGQEDADSLIINLLGVTVIE